MRNIHLRCIDLNSKYCPCLLAETNNCVFCSQLRGENTCDCNWCGVCVLYEKFWQTAVEGQGEKVLSRLEEEAEYTIVKAMADHMYILEFPVSAPLAEQLQKTGSFVFLRKPDDPQFCQFPVGIMDVTANKIKVAIEVVGPKSGRIFWKGNRRLTVKGPYYNGVFGQPWIENLTGGRVLVVAGGIGQAPALPLIKKLVENKNQVIAILAPGKVKALFIEEELRQLGVTVEPVRSMRQNGMKRLDETIRGKIDLVVSAGPDEQHQAVIAAMQAANINIPMAATNNATMCCGEGICGSCEKEGKNGEKLKLCKVQSDVESVLGE